MRSLAQIAFFLVLAFPSFGQTVGGAGWCKTSVNPNTITSLRVVNQRNMCSNVWDTLARKMYYYDYSLTVGSRWVEFVPLGPPIGAETKVEAGAGIGVAGNGTIATPYIISNTGDLSSTNELQYIDTLLYSSDTLRLSLSLDGRPQKKVYIPQLPGGIYGTPDTTTGNHIATIAADRTLTFRAQDDDAGGIVPFRVTSTGNEPDIMGLYADGDSLIFGKFDTEMRQVSSTGLSIVAANTLALQGDSVQVQTLPTAPSTEKTYVVQGTDAYLRTREGVPLSHLTQSGATTGQVPKWDGSAWVPDDDTGGGGGSSDSTWVKSDGTFGSDTLDNVRRTGKISLNTTSTDGQVTIGRDSAAATPAIVARYKDASNGAFNVLKLSPISQTGNGGGLLGDFTMWATNFPGVNVPYSSRANHVWRFGYNTSGGGGRVISTDADLHIAFESNFHGELLDGIRRRNWEWHLQSQDTTGGVHRIITAQGAHNGHSGDIGFNSDGLYVSRYNNPGTNWLQANRFTKLWAFRDSMVMYFDKNGPGGGGIFQRNAAGSAYVRLLHADASDRVALGGSGETSVYFSNGQVEIGGSAEVYSNTSGAINIGKSGINNYLTVRGGNPGDRHLAFQNAGGSNEWVFGVSGNDLFMRSETGGDYPWWVDKRGPAYTWRSTQSGNIGLGIYAPAAKLDILTSGGATSPLFRVRNSTGYNTWYRTNATPEGAITADPGDMAMVVDGSDGKLFLKESGAGNTGWARVMTPATGISGSGTTNYVTYWSGTQAITGSSNFTYNGTDAVLNRNYTNTRDMNLVLSGNVPGLNFRTSGASFSLFSGYYNPNTLSIFHGASAGNPSTNIANFTSDGRVGIGTASPSVPLHVVGNTLTAGRITSQSTGANAALYLNNTTASTGKEWYISSGNAGSLFIGNPTTADVITINGTTGATTIANTLTVSTATGTATTVTGRTSAGVITDVGLSGLSLVGGVLTATGGATDLTFSGSSSPVTLNSSTGTDVTFTAGGINAFSATSGNITITATEVDGSVTNELQTYGHSGTTSYTNTLSNSGGSFTLQPSGIVTVSNSSGTVTIGATEVDGSITNELQTIANTSDATSHTATLSNSGGSIQFVEGSGITMATTGTSGAGILTVTAVDASTTNELQTYSHAGTTTYTNTLSNSGGSWSITGAGIAAISQTGGAITVTATEVDGSVANEGLLGVGAGSGTSSVLLSNTSGATGVTINAAGINAITESTSANGGSITITATEVDGSVTNEGSLSVVAGGANDSEIQSNTSGSTNLVIAGGTNVTVTESGSTITISATPGIGGITTLNTLTASTQTFATGTSGTDFAISSATATHTFNLPTASASNRGALSSADWSAFNSKDGSVTNEGSLTVAAGSGTTSVIQSNTGGSTDVTLTASTGLSISETGNVITLTNSSPDQTVSLTNGGGVVVSGTYPNFTLTATDQSITNEVLTISDGTNSEALGGQTLTVAGAGINTAAYNTATNTLTITGTEIDGSISNEGSLTVGAGTGTTSIINSNTSGSTGVTLTASTGLSISESGNVVTLTNSLPDQTVSLTNGGGISVSGTYPSFTLTATDQSTTNELQTIANTSNSTTHTATLSNSGGSIQFVEGANITLTTSGTGLDGIVTIAATSGSGTDLSVTGTSSPVTLNSSTGTDVTFTAGGINSISATSGNITITATEIDGSVTNELQTLANTSDATSHTTTLSNSGGSIQLVEGSGITLATTGTSLDGVLTITAVDASATNELQTYSHGGTTTYTNTLSNSGGSWSLTGAGIAVISQTAGAVTVTATEVDGSISNEGSLTVGAGTGTTSIINSNTSGSTGVTLTASTGLSISESGNVVTLTNSSPDQTVSITNGGGISVSGTYPSFTLTATDQSTTNEVLTISDGTNSEALGGQTLTVAGGGINVASYNTGTNTLTITGTEVDGSVTNELQTFVNTSDATSHTVTLSNSGGSIQLVEGSGVTLTTSGTSGDGVVTIAAAGGGTNYQTFRDDGSNMTQQPAANFVSSGTVAFTLTNDGGNTETEIAAAVPTDGITATEIAAGAVGASELASTAVTPGSYLAANVTVDADGRITAASSGSIAYQTLRDDGVDKVQRFNVNFVSTPSVNAALTDDGGNNETEVRMSVATDGITATEIAAGAVGASELSSLGTAGTYGSATQVPVFTTDADGRVSAVTNTSITGTLSGLTATRVPFASGAAALADDANLTWNNTTKRLSIGNTGGSPAASLHIAEGSVASWEPLRAVGTVSGNMITTISNAQNSGGASNNLVDLSVGGASAGDAAYRWLINGVDTWSMGIDNSDADKWKLKKATTPSTGSNVGITMTADATPFIGINNDAPLHPLHVIGRATATVLQGISGTPTHTFGSGAGTGPSLGTLTGTTNGIDIQFTTGTVPAANGNVVSITYPTAFSNTSFPVFCAANAQTATDITKFYISAASATAMTITANGTLSASTTYRFKINISGR